MGSISGSVKLQFSQKTTAGRNQFQSPLDLQLHQTKAEKNCPFFTISFAQIQQRENNPYHSKMSTTTHALVIIHHRFVGVLPIGRCFLHTHPPNMWPSTKPQKLLFQKTEREVKIGFIQGHPSNYIMVQQYQQSILTFKITQGIRTRHILSQK